MGNFLKYAQRLFKWPKNAPFKSSLKKYAWAQFLAKIGQKYP